MPKFDLMAGPHHDNVKELRSSNIVEDVYNFESYNPQSSVTKTTPNAEDIA